LACSLRSNYQTKSPSENDVNPSTVKKKERTPRSRKQLHGWIVSTQTPRARLDVETMPKKLSSEMVTDSKWFISIKRTLKCARFLVILKNESEWKRLLESSCQNYSTRRITIINTKEIIPSVKKKKKKTVFYFSPRFPLSILRCLQSSLHLLLHKRMSKFSYQCLNTSNRVLFVWSL
jgi:hypothetical protein